MSLNPKYAVRMARSFESIYKRSFDPKAGINALDADWQSGYLLGCFTENETFEDIAREFKIRKLTDSKPLSDTTEFERKKIECFRSWKAGYWAGVVTKL